ncbi:DVU_1556 family methyltransferase [Chloroflexota bacterium]
MTKTEEIKAGVVSLYESCAFDQLLGETLRPGGLKLTARLADIAGIGESDSVLDIACGKGATAFFLSQEYGCRVIGIDLSDKMISSCRSSAIKQKLTDRVSFLRVDGENIPFHASSFDVVISECAFSLLPDKEASIRGIWQVLKSGGKLMMTDIILRGEVSKELQSGITFACCLAGAWRLEEYITLLERSGFRSPYIEDHSHELGKVGYQLGMTFGSVDKFLDRLPAGPCHRKGETTDSVPATIKSYQEFIRRARPGYALIAVTKA